MSSRIRVLLATSNAGKLREYGELAKGSQLEIEPIPNFDQIPQFEESAPTFAENSAGKALHYSSFTDQIILADDSGLSVAALGGAPGVLSARYAGPNATDMDRIKKLLHQMEDVEEGARSARFICVTSIAARGRAMVVASDFVAGVITREARGRGGFGYDPVFIADGLDHTFAEASQKEKNSLSHRGKAFRRVLALISGLGFGSESTSFSV